MKLPNDWKDRVKLNYVYKNMKELAKDLDVTIRENSADGKTLLQQLEKYFIVEFLPSPDKRCKKSHRFVVTARKQNVKVLVSITEEELQLLEQLRKDDSE